MTSPDISSTTWPIRQATWPDRERLVKLLGVAFSWPAPSSIDFRKTVPHLLCERRIGDHLLALDGQQIIGSIGIYGYDLRIDGVAVRGAAIGQVATLPTHRGKGVMRSLLQAAIVHVTEHDYQLAWLEGDRRRYGAYGWALGGQRIHYEFRRRMLPEPAEPAQVERLWPDEIVESILAHQQQLSSTALLSADELALLVAARKPVALRCGDAWLIHDLLGTEIHFASGPTHALGRLVAHVIASTSKDQLAASCALDVGDLNRLGSLHAHGWRVVPTCLWRITTLERTLGAAASMARERLGPGHDALALQDSQTGECVTLRCADGVATVTPGGERPLVFDTRQLSDLCFGVGFGAGMLDHLIPDLRPNSPLRQVLPMRAYHSSFLRV